MGGWMGLLAILVKKEYKMKICWLIDVVTCDAILVETEMRRI
jgi:hypothetical protein